METPVHPIYVVLFLGLPVLGILAYVVVCWRMTCAVEEPPYLSMLALFAGYGVVLLFIVSAICGEWSGMHWVALVGLLFVGLPWLVIQSLVMRRYKAESAYHRFTVVASEVFPLVLILFFVVAVVCAGLRR